MAALCQRPPWQQLSHLASLPGTPVRSLPTGSISVQTETIISHLRLRANSSNSSNSREADSPFTEKSSVKRVRGGGNATGVALKSLELWSADQARLRGSDDSAATSGSVFSEFRDPLQGQPGTILQVSVFSSSCCKSFFVASFWQLAPQLDEYTKAWVFRNFSEVSSALHIPGVRK